MRIVKTQKILYNHELRIRLIADNEDAEYIRLVRKLPDCKWSTNLNSWHTNNIQNHIVFLNKVFPAAIRFYDVSKFPGIPEIEEKLAEKRIRVEKNQTDSSLILHFLYDHELSSLIKNLGGNPYPEKGKAWKINNTPEIAAKLKSYFLKANYLIDCDGENDKLPSACQNTSIRIQVEQKLRENLNLLKYEKRTIDQYVKNVDMFLESTGENPGINPDLIRDFIDEMSISKNYSRSYQNLLINSIKAYYRFIHGVVLDRISLPRPRRDSSLPCILTKQEVTRIIQLIPNIKHNVIISTIYMTGITVSEAVSIKPSDIDNEKMEILIHRRKDRLPRVIPLPPELLKKIESYIIIFQPRNFLFEGYHGKQYSQRSIQKVLQKYVRRAGIQKKTTVHTLRHSYAGHLASEGIDIAELQKYLGHSSRRTTEIYRKVALCIGQS
jgi:integrase/recombinase XerD